MLEHSLLSLALSTLSYNPPLKTLYDTKGSGELKSLELNKNRLGSKGLPFRLKRLSIFKVVRSIIETSETISGL